VSNDHEYTLPEAAEQLGWAPTTLRDKCGRYEVPHHRRHNVKGIYFTEADIEEIRAARSRRPGQRPCPDPSAACGTGITQAQFVGVADSASPSAHVDEIAAALSQFTPRLRMTQCR